MTEVERALKPFAARLRLLRSLKWAGFGLMTGAAAALLIRASSYLWPFPTSLWWCALACVCIPVLFLLIAWLCPMQPLYVARKVDARGLQARAQTALMLKDVNTPMAILQRGDTLEQLRSASPERLLPVSVKKLPLIFAAACALLFGLSFVIANPQTELLQARAEYRAQMTREAELVDEGAAKLDAREVQTPELRKLLGDLSRELRSASDAKDTLKALDNAEKTIEEMRATTVREAKKALEANGLSELAKALESGDDKAAQEALEKLQADEGNSALSQAAQSAADAAAAKALSDAAKALSAGNMAQAAQALQTALSGNSAAIAQALALSAMVRNASAQLASAAAGASGGSGTAFKAGVGASSASGAKAGAGAGLGSSDKDAGYSELQSAGTSAAGKDPQKKVSQYEPIYDPTRLNTESVQTNEKGRIGEGEISEAEAGLGVGSADGAVPYNEVLAQYSQQAVEASQGSDLPAYAQSWVEQYFRLLSGE